MVSTAFVTMATGGGPRAKTKLSSDKDELKVSFAFSLEMEAIPKTFHHLAIRMSVALQSFGMFCAPISVAL